MKKFLLAALLALASISAHAQSVQQSGSVTPNTVPRWVSTGVIGGGVTAADSPITNFGVTRDGADGICVASARSSAVGRNTLCLQASTTGAAKIVLQNYGTAVAQDLQFVINGNAVTIPTGGTNFIFATGALVSGHMPCFSGTSGLVVDCGVGAVAGTQYGQAIYTAAGAIGGTAALTNGQIVVGVTGAVPVPRTLSGDVSSISSAGAVTLAGVNGVTYPASFTAGAVLYAPTTSTVAGVSTNNIGYCLLSQATSPPIWASCASGSGSAGGSNTQVQFNNSTSLGGSVNFTWSSPALTLGVAGTTTGQLALASSTATGTVTLQAPGVSGTYNFNFPTGAGSSGQPLLSGGGGATPNTFGTLGVAGGGTNCAAASGTCLDNITNFSSTGYVNRTGSGTYAFSAQIPVSSGGTGLASGTSGGILGYTASGTLASSAALAANGVVIGGGAGATPTAITACSNGQLVVGATAAPPACQTMGGDISAITSGGSVTIANSAITNAKLANAAAYTLKGNFTGSSAAVTDTTIGALTQKASPAAGDYLLIADNAAAGQMKYATVSSVASAGSVSSINSQTGAITFQQGISNSSTTFIFDQAYHALNAASNCTVGWTTSSNNLTIAILTAAGNTPSATDPCAVNFRNATIGTGTIVQRLVTGATTMTLNGGSSLGGTTSPRVWAVFVDTGSTAVIGVYTAFNGTNLQGIDEAGIVTTTACAACTNATAGFTFYTAVAQTSKPYRIAGYADWEGVIVTPGTWAGNPTRIQVFGPGIKKPGDRVKLRRTATGAVATGTTTTNANDTINTSATGDSYLAESLTPDARPNQIVVRAQAILANSTTGQMVCFVILGGAGNALAANNIGYRTAGDAVPLILNYSVLAGVTTSLAYTIRCGLNNAGTTTFNGTGGTRTLGGVSNSFIEVEEIMG